MANYITTDTELTSVANAIRQKGKTSAPLVYPAEFVSAINDIQSGGATITDTTDSHGGTIRTIDTENPITVEPLEVTQNGTYTAPSGKAYSPVTVDVKGGGGDVIFYDYDGSVVASYSASDFANLSALPANPTHTGLTAQGWNWSLANIKSYLTKYPGSVVNVGQMYITDDGKTRVYIHLEEGRTSPMMGLCVNGSVDIDWGDGTEHTTLTGTSISTVVYTENHNYAAPGDYVIRLTVTGSLELRGQNGSNTGGYLLRYNSEDNRNCTYKNAVKKVEIGNNVTGINDNAFYDYYSLASITIPDSVISIGQYAFYQCYSLSSITIPDGITSVGTQVFRNCYSLASITIPDDVTSIGSNTFYNCNSLASITIPDGVTSIGQYAFYQCYSLSSITIPDGITSVGNYLFRGCSSLASITIPAGVKSIGSNAFYDCNSLASITIPDGVTSIGNSAFQNCQSLASITIPAGVKSIGTSVFQSCQSLESITIPAGVKSIGNYEFCTCYSLTSITIPDSVKSIGSQAFQYCKSIASITIPDSVTSVDTLAFQYCYGMAEYHFLSTTPPTLSNTNAFSGIPADCIIYVPQASLEAYKTATNWSTYASYMQGE